MRTTATHPGANPNTPPIPQPTRDIHNLAACVAALKEATESLIGQRGAAANRAVTFNDLVNYGVLDHSAVSSPPRAGVGAPGANQPITLSGDTTGSGTTSIATTVTGLQGRPVAATAPGASEVLAWDGSAWEPAPAASGGIGGGTVHRVRVSTVSTTLNAAVANGGLLQFDTVHMDSDGFAPTTSPFDRLTIPAGLGGVYILSAWSSSSGTQATTMGMGVLINGTQAFSETNQSISGPASVSYTLDNGAMEIGQLVAGDYLQLINNSVSAGTNIFRSTIVSLVRLEPSGPAGAPGAGAAPSTTLPLMDGAAVVGVAATYTRGDHVHPIDTSRAPLASPALTGNPTAPTPTAGDNDTSIATTAFVGAAVIAAPNKTITLSGDTTGSGTAAITTTLATVNTNIGTYQGITINGKGLVTAAADQGYLTVAGAAATYAPIASPTFTGDPKAPTPTAGDNDTSVATTAFVTAAVTAAPNQTITLGGDLSGSGTTSITATLTANSVVTTDITDANITYAKVQNVAAARLLGNPTGSPVAPSEISLGTNLTFAGTVLNAAAGASGLSGMTVGQIPIAATATTVTSSANLSGDVVSTPTTLATTIQANAVTTTKILNANVTYAKIQNVAASRVLGNPTGLAAAPSEISLGTGLAFAGTVLNGASGTLTGVTAGTGITVSGAAPSPTVTLTTPVAVANGGTGLASGTSGGIPYYSATGTIASSAALTVNRLVRGGGAGAAPADSSVGEGAFIVYTGYGAATDACGIEIGQARTGTGDSYIDFHSTSGSDYELRLYRTAGANGNVSLVNTGTGSFQLLNPRGVQVQGTSINDNAGASIVGEYVESNVPAASGTLATTATPLNVTSISLTAGDWDVTGSVLTIPTAGCVLTDFRGAISIVSATTPDASRYAAWGGSITNPTIGLAVPQQRISISATTTVYLVSYQAFSTAALRICGTIGARRVR